MLLTEKQNDSLTELINISFARTAGSLSQLSGHRVILDVPKVSVHPIGELAQVLSQFLPNEVATVHQIFTGPVSGDALLLLDYDGAIKLTDLLAEERTKSTRLSISAREVLTETGNILLNACLGMFGNLLKVQVGFSVPRLHLESLDELLQSVTIDREGLRYAIAVTTAFRLRDSAIEGYLVIILGVASLDRLVRAVELWEERQHGGG
jgi:chemotaxis protein CheC